MRLIFRNIRLNIQRVHIRYEDDYYQSDLGRKFVFGLTLSHIYVGTANENWNIDTSGKAHFRGEKINQLKYAETSNDSANLLLKEF